MHQTDTSSQPLRGTRPLAWPVTAASPTPTTVTPSIQCKGLTYGQGRKDIEKEATLQKRGDNRKGAVNEKREKRRKRGSQKGGLFPLSRTGWRNDSDFELGAESSEAFFLYTKEGRVFFLPKAFSFMLCMGEVFVLCMGGWRRKESKEKA